MIIRTWRGATAHEDADRYVEYLRATGVREYRTTPGNLGVYLLRRPLEDRVEFLLISMWVSMEAVQRFAGDDPDRAVFYPQDDAFLVRRDEHVEHFDVVEGPQAASEP